MKSNIWQVAVWEQPGDAVQLKICNRNEFYRIGQGENRGESFKSRIVIWSSTKRRKYSFDKGRVSQRKMNVNVTLYHHTSDLQRDLDEVRRVGTWGGGGGLHFQICLYASFLSKATAPFNICTNEKWTKVWQIKWQRCCPITMLLMSGRQIL